MNNYAYVSLLSSENYLKGILTLNYSLKLTNTKYPLVVLITENVAENKKILKIFEQEQIAFKIIKQIVYCEEEQKNFKNTSKNYLLNTASKIHIFDLNEYDKILYLDADILVLKNLDELFQYKNGSMIESLFNKEQGETEGDSNFFICIPKFFNFEDCQLLIEQRPGLDGRIISDLFFPLRDNPEYLIPYKYCIDSDNDNFNITDIYSVHFGQEKKPWQDTNYFIKNQYYQKYYEYLAVIEKKYDI